MSVIKHTSGNSLLNDLVSSVKSVLATEHSSARRTPSVARALLPFLGDPRLLTPEQRQPDAERYRQHILYVEETGAFSVHHTNDLAAATEAIAAESRTFYLLGFHPRAGERAGHEFR